MMFVRPAQNHLEQNLVAYQYGSEIFYTSIKNIQPKQELKVSPVCVLCRMCSALIFLLTLTLCAQSNTTMDQHFYAICPEPNIRQAKLVTSWGGNPIQSNFLVSYFSQEVVETSQSLNKSNSV